MSGQANGLEALVALLAFLAVLCVVFGVGAWLADRFDAPADEDYGRYERERVGR